MKQLLVKKIIYPFLKHFSPKEVKSNTMSVNPSSTIYDIALTDIQGVETNLSLFKGKKILIVNTASECGYTPQYAQLQDLYDKTGDKLAVLGFPSNDFGAQEPGTDSQILGFCEKNYGVTFPLFSKVKVIGSGKHPLFNWLTNPSLNGWNSQEPTWNFCKYLIDENGKLLHFFSAGTSPFDERITG
jgi:glutathione peroxidase